MKFSNLSYFTPNRSSSMSVEPMDNVADKKVYITHCAFTKMMYYVKIATGEVGWLGTVERVQSGYLIRDVFLLEQEVAATTTALTPDGLAKFAEEIMQEPDGLDKYNMMKFWGHSHVNMGVTPSHQDDQTMENFEESGHDFMIRGIFNKRGDVKLDVYDYEKRLIYKDMDWMLVHVEDEGLEDRIQEEFDAKVTTAPVYNYQNRGVPSWQRQAGYYQPPSSSVPNRRWCTITKQWVTEYEDDSDVDDTAEDESILDDFDDGIYDGEDFDGFEELEVTEHDQAVSEFLAAQDEEEVEQE